MLRNEITEVMDVLKKLKYERINYRVFLKVSNDLHDKVENIYEKERGNVFLKLKDVNYKYPNYHANDTFYQNVLHSLENMSEICKNRKDSTLFYSYVDKAICHLQFID